MKYLTDITGNPSHRHLVEAIIWTGGLLAVGLADPRAESLIELCLFKAVGLSGCPGCGLGHAMGFLFRGEWNLALSSHIFSPVVLVFLLHRIGSLVRSAIYRIS